MGWRVDQRSPQCVHRTQLSRCALWRMDAHHRAPCPTGARLGNRHPASWCVYGYVWQSVCSGSNAQPPTQTVVWACLTGRTHPPRLSSHLTRGMLTAGPPPTATVPPHFPSRTVFAQVRAGLGVGPPAAAPYLSMSVAPYISEGGCSTTDRTGCLALLRGQPPTTLREWVRGWVLHSTLRGVREPSLRMPRSSARERRC